MGLIPDVPIGPNALLSIRNYLAGHTYMTSYNVDRVAPNLNGYEQGMRWVILSPAPGSRVSRNRLDVRTFTLNCYAEDYDSTLRLCERALAAVLSMRGNYGIGDDEIVVSETQVSVTPYDLTDQLNGRYRFVSDVTVYYRRA